MLNFRFFRAVKTNNGNLVKQLMSGGATNLDSEFLGAALGGYIAMAKFFLDLNADIEADNNDALVEAAGNGDLPMVKFLLDNGAPATDKDLKDAALYGHLEIVKLLVQNGSEITDKAIEYAEFNNHMNIVNYLENQLNHNNFNG